MITPSATNATLQTQGFTTFHRIVPNDNVEGSQGADWLARKGIKKLFVLQDLSAYGKGVGDTVAKEAKAKGITVIEQGLDGTTTKNYNPIAQTITASGADAMFYGGYDAQAALLAKALKSAGFKGITVGGNGIKSTRVHQELGYGRRRLVHHLWLPGRDRGAAVEGVHRGVPGDVQHPAVDLLAGGVRRHQRADPGHQDGGQRAGRRPGRRSRPL